MDASARPPPSLDAVLAESIADWPDRDGVSRMVEAAGWTGVEVRNLSGGVVALHTAHRPAGR